MLDDDIQRKILRDSVKPEPALSVAVNMEMCHQNQQRILSNNNCVIAIQQFRNFLTQIPVCYKQTELHSIEKQMAFVGIVDKTGHQNNVSFAPFWVRNVTTVDF